MRNPTTRSGIASILTIAATLAVALNAPAASAAPPRGPESPGATYISAYPEPLDALGGRTPAQYLADHRRLD
jgi:hypothetical protein